MPKGFPSIRIGTAKVPRVILGCQPFIGESYQGPAKNRLYARRFTNRRNLEKILVRAVLNHGISALAAVPASSSPLASSLLEVIKEIEGSYKVKLGLAPCLSIRLKVGSELVDDYRRWLTYFYRSSESHRSATLDKYLKDPILLARPGWRRRFPEALRSLHPYEEEEAKSLLFDDLSIREAMKSLQGRSILFIEPGSETDFLVAMERFDLLEGLIGLLRGLGFRNVLFGVHHAGKTIQALEASGLRFQGYVTPVNLLGAMMFPSQNEALRAIRSSSKPVVAIKPLAGGRIKPLNALQYVFKTVGADACMVGVASEAELDEDMEAARRAIA